MAIPLKNTIYEMIKDAESITDSELSKALIKEGFIIPEDKFNKLLLDLEILGLIKVSWLAKDTRRIEVVIQQTEQDAIEEANKEMMERDYEASFPGADSD